jgi:hypothetical protein
VLNGPSGSKNRPNAIGRRPVGAPSEETPMSPVLSARPAPEVARENPADCSSRGAQRIVWVIGLPSASRRWLAFLAIFGSGLLIAIALPDSPEFYVWFASGSLALISGCTALWSG